MFDANRQHFALIQLFNPPLWRVPNDHRFGTKLLQWRFNLCLCQAFFKIAPILGRPKPCREQVFIVALHWLWVIALPVACPDLVVELL